MKFGIVVPTYKEEKDIAGTFNGLPVLDYPDKEIIVMDDPTDATPCEGRSGAQYRYPRCAGRCRHDPQH